MKKKLTKFEVVWYILMGALLVWGLTYITLGVICRFISVESGLYKANLGVAKAFGLGGFFWWGIIIMFIAVLLAIIVLLVYASKADNKFEKENRRAARLARNKKDDASEVVDVEAKPAE